MTTESTQSAAKPPYNFPFSTVRTFVGHLRESVLPSRIEKSLMKRLSGTGQAYMLPALRFFGLVDARDVPRPELKSLVEADTPDAEKAIWLSLIQSAYTDLLNSNINLATVPDGEFMEKLHELYGYENNTLRKCAAFFLGAAEFVGMAMSPHLKKNRGPSPGRPPGKRKSKKRPEDEAETGNGTPAVTPVTPSSTTKSKTELFLEKFPAFDPNWDEKIQAKWFEGYEKLMGLEAGGAK